MIKSPKNRVFKDIRRLKRCKGDHAVLEGPHLVREAVAAGIELETVLVTQGALARDEGGLPPELIDRAIEVAPEALESVTDSDSPRGVLAVARLPRGGVDRLPRRGDGIYVFLDGLQDPGNLGAVARAVEASGATALALSTGCADPNHPRALRASAGSLLRLPTAVGVEPGELAGLLRDLGPTWFALSARGERSLYSTQFKPPLVLVVGGERGLDPEIEAHCDQRLRIPMAPPVESLNAAVAAALALFEMSRQAS